jgi:hypothetical protein
MDLINRKDHRKIGARTGTQVDVTDGVSIRLRGNRVPYACNSEKNAKDKWKAAVGVHSNLLRATKTQMPRSACVS